jgi:hypothetical protein
MDNQGIPIIGLYGYESPTQSEMQPQPNIPNDKALDGQKYDEWVQKFSPQFQPALKDLKDKIQYVSFQVFADTLTAAFQNFRKKEIDGYIAFIEPEKSQKWATELLMRVGLQAQAYLCLGEEGANRLKDSFDQFSKNYYDQYQHLISQKMTNYVIVDDGAYSGNQMANNISQANAIIKEKTGQDPTFHVIVPYITKTALEKLGELQKKQINIHVYHITIMPTISEAVPSKHLQTIKDVFWKGMDQKAQTQRPTMAALHWFAHKVPNQMSFPDVLAQGTVTHPKNLNANNEEVRFIPKSNPPYKDDYKEI